MRRWQVIGIPDGESGNYKVEAATTTTGEPSWLNYVNYAGVQEGDYTVLYQKFGESWLNIMQDSHREYDEHEWLRSRLSGDILIGGLGLGVCQVGMMARGWDITSVTIVEKEQDVIDLVWEHCAKDDRFSIVHADINTWTPPEGSSWDVGWFDTWLTHDLDADGNLMTVDGYRNMIETRYGSYVTEISGWNWN